MTRDIPPFRKRSTGGPSTMVTPVNVIDSPDPIAAELKVAVLAMVNSRSVLPNKRRIFAWKISPCETLSGCTHDFFR